MLAKIDFLGLNQVLDTKIVSLLLRVPTNSEAIHHLSVGSTTIGGSITLNVYLYLLIQEIITFFFAEGLYSSLSVFFFIPLFFVLPIYAIYDIYNGIVALLYSS